MEKQIKKDIRSVLLHGMHDHGHGLSLISNYISLIRRKLEKENLLNGELLKYLEGLSKGKDRCKESADYMWNKIYPIVK